MEELTLEELMRLCFNSGYDASASDIQWDDWWEEYGKDRHDEFISERGVDAPSDS